MQKSKKGSSYACNQCPPVVVESRAAAQKNSMAELY